MADGRDVMYLYTYVCIYKKIYNSQYNIDDLGGTAISTVGGGGG